MSELKLEVGKKYKDNVGNISEIIKINDEVIIYGRPMKPMFIARPNILGKTSSFLEDGHSLTVGFNNLISEYTEPKKLSGWVNVYHQCSSRVYECKESADEHADSNRLAVINLSQFNEGEGL